MAIFNRLPDAVIRRNFQHYGLMFGFVPVYVGDADSEAPKIEVRNGWPDWLLDVGQGLWNSFSMFRQLIDPFYEPTFMIKLMGRIESVTEP